MEDKLEDFLSSCSKIDFGSVDLSGREKEFYKGFNREIISLCDSLPESAQLDALLFFIKYSGLSIGQELDFYKNYYVPSWSIIYWLIDSDHEDRRLTQEDIKNAKTAHSMAMILHSMDDHISDKEIPASHLTLLLRSQSWVIMNNSFTGLADGVDGGYEIVQGFIDDYYSSIYDPEEIESLDSYCDLFRKQMATWLIVPVLMTKRMTTDEDFIDAIQIAYGSFGIAWRLLDDIMDIKIDMKNGTHSSIYICLPENIREFWDKNEMTESNNDSSCYDIILDYIHKNGVINRTQQRIAKELELAASISENHNMIGLAGELRSLLIPFRDKRNPL